MGRGDAKRKRSNRALRAKAEKKNLDPHALLEHGNKAKKRKINEDGMPASLRKMLQLKAIAEGRPSPRLPKNTVPGQLEERGRKNDRNTSATVPLEYNNDNGATEEDIAEEKLSTKQKRSLQLPVVTAPIQQQPSKSLKARKKEFLKKKKLRKKGKYNGDAEEESNPEEHLRHLAEATRPRFAETADQPMEIHLKRKHWNETEKNKPSDRHKLIYMKQLEGARKSEGIGSIAEADRVHIIETYRKNKKPGNAESTATLQSLAALVKKDPVSAM